MTTNSTTHNRKYYLGAAAVILASLAGISVAYPHLPTMVPTHWDFEGHINGWSHKWALFLIGPGLMSATVLMFWALPWLSPKKFEVDSFRDTYLYIMIVILALLAYCQILTLVTALGLVLDVGRAITGGVCLLIALLGNVLGKVRRNFYVGIRTPWTIASEQVWIATHRLGAKTLFVGGIVGLLAVILRAWSWIPMTAIAVAVLVPVIYSLVFYKQLERRGQLT